MPSFLSPLFLIGALTAAVPILLHLLKRQPEPRVRFPAVKLLKDAPVEHTDTRRIRELLLLALRVAALVFLSVAFARPFLASGSATGATGATIVALDVSFSMSAPGVFDRARQLAKAAITRASPGDAVGVVTFADSARLDVKPSADRALALAAIEGATTGFGATRYRSALSAAVDALGERRGTIVVVTDLQETGWDAGGSAAVPESDRIEIADVGPVPPNLAVTAVNAIGDRIVASVRNTGDTSRDTRVHLELDGRAAGAMPATVGQKSTADVEFAGASKASTAVVRVDDPSGAVADNSRYLVLGASSRPLILVVTGNGELDREAFYVQQALAADGSRYQVLGASASRLAAEDAVRLSANAAVVLLSTRGLERRDREALAAYVKGGGGLVIAAGPDVDGEVVADVLGQEVVLRVTGGGDEKSADRRLAPADIRHPIFRPFSGGASTLGLVRFRQISRIEGSGCQTVARFATGEPALLECSAGEGRAFLLASDLDNKWNDFPLRASFVPFLHEMVRYLEGNRPRTGEYLVADVPAGIQATPGIAAVVNAAGTAKTTRYVAVNVDPRESDPARIAADEFQKSVSRLKVAGASDLRAAESQQDDRLQLWRYVLALVLAVLVVESVVASRTA
jgi:hypothetical protein